MISQTIQFFREIDPSEKWKNIYKVIFKHTKHTEAQTTQESMDENTYIPPAAKTHGQKILYIYMSFLAANSSFIRDSV